MPTNHARLPRRATRKPAAGQMTIAPVSQLSRWVNRGLLVTGVGLVSAGLYQGGTHLSAQQVERLTVMGDVQHIDIEAIQSRLAPRVAAGFLATNLTDLRHELESLPWVYRVNTRRRWPAEIEVTLTEQRPLARWGEGGYLNHEGEVFAATPDPLYQDLPLLIGQDGAEVSLMRRYQTLAGLLEPTGLQISELSLDPLGQVAVRFDSGLSLLLGAKDISHRVKRFKRLWEEELPAQAVAKVDLRYEYGAAVTFSDAELAMQGAQNRGGRVMAQQESKQMIVGLDIGTSKVVAVVGEIDPDGGMEVMGIGSHPSRGMKKGVVVNIESTVNAIQRAVEEAELMAGCQIHSVYVGIAGSHIRSVNSHGIVAIRDQEVFEQDIDRVIDAAQAVAIPADQKVLHVLPQEYVIDNQSGIREPLGMSGVRLEAKVHLVTCAVNAAQNIEKCIERCGLSVDGIILEQLASSYSVITEDERDLGVCLVDIGGGTSDIAIFTDGSIRHTGVIPIAGDQVTNDIAMALRTPTQHAEEIKIRYACALTQLAGPDETIKVPSVGDRPPRDLSRQSLAEVVEPRYDELFTLIQSELRRSGYEELIAAGVVLTGGTSKMEGAVDLAEEIFHMPVRVGAPQYARGLHDIIRNPIYATAVGLLLYGAEETRDGVRVRQDVESEGLSLIHI